MKERLQKRMKAKKAGKFKRYNYLKLLVFLVLKLYINIVLTFFLYKVAIKMLI